MNSAETPLFTVAVTMCVFSAGLLRRSREGRTFAWLTWFLALEAASFALELLMAHPAAPLKGLWLGLRLGGSLLIAPVLWLAVREALEGRRPRLADLGRGPLVAIGIGWVLTLPLIEDANLGLTYGNPQLPVSWLHARFIHATMLGCIGIFAVQAPMFLWRCRAVLLARTRARGSAQAWLQLPLLVVATTWLLGLLRTAQCAAHAPKELALVLALADAAVTVGSVYVMMKRVAVAELDTPADDSVVASMPPPAALSAAPAARKYVRSTLDAGTRARIRRKLEQAAADSALLADSLLNLRSLSRTVGEKAHYVSQVLNEDLGMTFYAWLSWHRIERARHLLRVEPDRTILEIALAVGFNSKSTFNTAFRRVMGMTPSAFRDSGRG